MKAAQMFASYYSYCQENIYKTAHTVDLIESVLCWTVNSFDVTVLESELFYNN